MAALPALSLSHTASAVGCNILAISGVTASGSQTGNPATNAIDTKLDTRWSNLGLGSSITVDFGKERAICNVNVAWYRGNERVNTFTISVSNDGNSFTNVFSGKSSGATTSFESYDFPDTSGRYVKITVNGNSQNGWISISEIRVLGDLLPAPSPSPPIVTSTIPASGATGIPVTISKIAATFNEPILPSSVSSSSFTLKVSGGSTSLVGTYSLSNTDGGKTVMFSPSSLLSPDTAYTVSLTTGIKDQAGDALSAPKTWSFTTATAPEPSPSPNDDCKSLSISKVSEAGGKHSLGPKYAVDGNVDTRWSMQGAGSTITIDLGKKHVICNVEISWYRGTERISNFVISLSTNGKSFTNIFSGTSSGSTDGFERYNFPDATARYIKITVNGNTLNNWASISEIRVFGDPSTTSPPPPPKQEICGDGIDNNGDGQIDEGCSIPPPPPPKQEICGDGIDNNGDGQIDEGCSAPPPPPGSDGVKEIYPTAPGGETWFFNPDNPIDGQFDPNGASISRNSDGSWHLKPGTTRMLAFPKSDGLLTDSVRSSLPTYDYSQLAQIGYWYKPTDWKNTEVTGYFKVTSSNQGDGISLVTRSVRHSNSVHNGCGGSSYHNNIRFDGTFQYKKEMWHVNYDILPPTKNGIGSIMNKWVGFKGIVYNLPNGNVKLESYVDKDANNNWQKVEELIDSGNWGNDMTHCGANKQGAQITWGSPMPIFKSTGVTYDFKKLSVREIVPPS